MSFQQDAFQQDAFQVQVPDGGAATPPQRLTLWSPLALVALGFFAPDEDTRSRATSLHAYRVGYQTVGQNYRLWPPAAKADQTIEPDAQRLPQTLLHRHRTGYQTVSQSYRLWARTAPPRTDEAEYAIPKPSDLSPYRQSAATSPGAPWYLWTAAQAGQKYQVHLESEAYGASLAASLHAYRATAPASSTDSTLEWPTVWTWTDRPKWRWSVSGNHWVVTS